MTRIAFQSMLVTLVLGLATGAMKSAEPKGRP